jgi:hypothetical protein
MVYCRESLMTDFSKSTGLPVINENCPACFEEPKERARVKKLLSREELSHPNFYDNIRRSLLPLMHGDMEAILHRYTEDVVTKVRKRLVPSNIPRIEASAVAEEKKTEALLPISSSLAEASEADLLRELARRKAQHHRLAGAAKRRKIAPKESAAAVSTTAAAAATCTIDGACSFFD